MHFYFNTTRNTLFFIWAAPTKNASLQRKYSRGAASSLILLALRPNPGHKAAG